MTTQKTESQLYHELILRHHRDPHHFGELKTATHHAEGYNHVCGDHVTVYLDLDAKDKIKSLQFTADACAVCRASASMMCDLLEGKSSDEALNLVDDWVRGLKSQTELITVEKFGEASTLRNLEKYPARINCARLPWQTLLAATEGRGYLETGGDLNQHLTKSSDSDPERPENTPQNEPRVSA